jgi:sensor c-di-GMP phosphodiesterase-like protein
MQNMVDMEITNTLRGLNESGLDGCGDEALQHMRHVLFQSYFVKEVAYYEDNKVACNTTEGRIATPLTLDDPDFETHNGERSEVWINRPVELEFMERDFNAMIVRVGKYSFMYDSNSIFIGDSGPFLWELVHVHSDTGKRTLINSLENFIRLAIPDFTPSASIRALDFFACNPAFPEHCLTLSASVEGLLIINSKVFVLIGLLGLTLGFTAFVLMRQLLLARSKAPWRARRAIRHDAFSCHFQPLVEIESGRIIGCEVLARLQDYSGAMGPDEFLPEIKQQQMTWVFTRQIIHTTFSMLEVLHTLPDGFRVCLNIFPQDINSGAVRELLEMPVVMNSRFNICLEIIEDELLDVGRSQETLNDLADAGFEIAIDDFGTGYSNLKQIERMRCTSLKIDRSFIMNIDPESLRTCLIPHMVSIAAEIGVTLIAEGIETEEQQSYLLGIGVSYGQGYLFSRPLDIHGFISLINNDRAALFSRENTVVRLEVVATTRPELNPVPGHNLLSWSSGG